MAPPAEESAAPPDRRAAERARRAAALRRLQEQRRARAGLRSTRRRPALAAVVVTLAALIITITLTGALIVTAERPEPVPLASPLHVYPVTQVVAGACPAGTQGITEQTTPSEARCYHLSSGIAIRQVAGLRVQPGRTAGSYDVAIDLIAADRRAFGELTRIAAGRSVAFVVNGRLVTAPRVEVPITDGKVVVTGSLSRAEADRLVSILRGP